MLALSAIALLLTIIVYHDLRSRHVPPRLVLAIALVSLFLLFSRNFDGHSLYWTLGIILVGIFLSRRNMLGGGDTKLLAAIMLGVHAQLAALLILSITLLGAVQAIAILLFQRLGKVSRKRGVPYTLPIAACGFAATSLTVLGANA